MYKRHQLGKDGENIAAEYLKEKGYEIVERNFFCKQGEIDIIARNSEYVVFVEVKTRSGQYFGRPVEAVNDEKQLRLYRCARYYLYKNHLEEEFVRFDVIEVLYNRGVMMVNHIKQIL